MKKIFLSLAIVLASFVSGAQVMNCGSFCVLSIGNIDTVNNELDVTIFNGDTNQVNYPTVVLVNGAGDTVANIGSYFYYFAHPAGDTLVHTIPTTLDSIPAGFTCTVYLTDQIYDTTCSFSYPMSCITGVAELASAGKLSIWPNPAQDVFSISAKGMTEKAAYSIFDARGRIVRSGELEKETTTISAEGLTGGIYWISASDGKIRCSAKLIIGIR